LEKLRKILREKNKSINSTFISSYIPRKCGIATYTKDLTNKPGRSGTGGRV